MRLKKDGGGQESFFVYVPYNVAHGPQDMPPDARAGVSARTATIEDLDKNVGRLLKFLDASCLAAEPAAKTDTAAQPRNCSSKWTRPTPK